MFTGYIGAMKPLAVLVLLCYGAAVMAEESRAIPPGTWGGEHVVLELTERGGELEFDCARGRFDGPLRVDAKGRFDVKGTFTPQHGGPIRRDEKELHIDTRYVGHVAGKTMTLKLLRGEKDLGSFTLVHGARPI